MQRKGLRRQLAGAWESSLKLWRKKHHPVFAPWFAFADLPEKEFEAKAKDLAAAFHANGDPAKPVNPLVARMFANTPTSMGQVAARYSAVFADVDKRWQNVLAAYGARKKGADTPPPEPVAFPDAASEEIRKVLYDKKSPTYLDEQRINDLINRDNKIREQLANLKKSVNDLKSSHPGSPARAHVLEDAAQPKDSFVFLRGNPGTKGPIAVRQFLQILSGENRQPFKNGSGRLELARAIATRDNPLTARVMANRVWLHHFGEGLARTPDDFGTRSDPPTHPELLDYLAWQFVEDGWSLKKLHRRIMLSSVYQQSSEDNPRFAQIDPDNRFLWQMNRRRLDFEALRDTLLAIGGKLDLTLGGPSVRLNAEPYSRRRSVYGYIDRSNLPNLLVAFDFANPDLTTGKRDNTIVPQQALFMMNSPLVVEQARELVRREDFRSQSRNEERLRLLYQLIYQRTPTPVEMKLALDYLGGESATTQATSGQSAWEYGYGEFDPASKRLKQFVLMSSFSGKSWQPGTKAGNSQLGNVSLNADGGMPGNQFAAIRRWTAPRDGFIAIDGVLSHGSKEGDGVFGRIVSSRIGPVGQWVCFKSQVPTQLPRLLVQRGETVDFMVDCRSNPRADAFTWAPNIKMNNSTPNPNALGVVEWNAKTDFGGTERLETKDRLSAWEKFAQVLLETNELTFVN
ncbi:MAG: DUF1553 domain-containing protein [Pedosphaera sp.]|nr:DUF1553 domain-containing protein [Pedosphaera sp.]